ncbi:hypothetical protein B5807_01164 [Epicoccum nigrum]|uniref:Uncharacterized protein n=1 Tax=Epicoccum nigrum TaxID=105696 RepID=A0A1Y2MH98_EPING|nr:hypothetical protein B5807_01164 [Epicoccum nigrum]
MADAYNLEFFNVSFPAEYVAHVEINRPEKMNAFKEVMWHNLSKIFTALSTDPSVRAILFTGAGRAFTAGLDVTAASSSPTFDTTTTTDGARKAFGLRRHILEFQECISALEKCEKPVICVLHGVSYGLALDMSLSCDVRIAAKDARFSVKEVDIGLAADIGTLSRLPHAVGNMSWIKEVALSARVFGAEEAMQVGLVSRVVEDKEAAVKEALELASLIASKSPVAVLGTKEILNYSRDKTVAEGLNYTAVWNAAMLQTDDIKEAMLSGMQKRKVKFSKL